MFVSLKVTGLTLFFSFTGPLVYFTIKILKKLLIIKK